MLNTIVYYKKKKKWIVNVYPKSYFLKDMILVCSQKIKKNQLRKKNRLIKIINRSRRICKFIWHATTRRWQMSKRRKRNNNFNSKQTGKKIIQTKKWNQTNIFCINIIKSPKKLQHYNQVIIIIEENIIVIRDPQNFLF